MAVRQASDAGTPPAAGNGPEAAAFHEIAAQVGHWLDRRQG
jgi:ATP-binding protein involved in chromosome partitioning